MATKQSKEREDRINMEILVDAYDAEERAMGWHSYPEDTLGFPFTARCTAERPVSPLKKGDEMEVLAMAPPDECQRAVFVMIRSDRKKDGLAVPLSQLQAAKDTTEATVQAVDDWRYWAAQGYEF